VGKREVLGARGKYWGQGREQRCGLKNGKREVLGTGQKTAVRIFNIFIFIYL
jgi:hypothetical protein